MRCLLISDIIVVCAQCVLLIEQACVKALILSEKTLILSEKALILSEKALILSEKGKIMRTPTPTFVYIQYNAVANWSRSVRQKNVL